MAYDAPGRADVLPDGVVRAWNRTIVAEHRRQDPTLVSRFFSIDVATLATPTPAVVKWFGDPAEPAFCRSLDVARKLSDWLPRSRPILHNEYCEYTIIFATDSGGRIRPKRVEVTTELREYWVCVAEQDPVELKKMARRVLGRTPSFAELYGIDDPQRVTAAERRRRFVAHLAPPDGAAPGGPLNTDRALFMNQPINGLDDLIYIVMFGAVPYAVEQAGRRRPATRDEIFRAAGVEHLACRHADPAAAMGAQAAAWQGSTVAFANPLGMYILGFDEHLFTYRGQAVPARWVRWSRGQRRMRQRLVFGPSDTDDAFLDDIVVTSGANDEPVTGGFQVVQHIEVGPLVVVGAPSAVLAREYRIVPRSTASIRCNRAEVCAEIRRLEGEYDDAHDQIVRIAPRTMGRPA
jgi:hypothetical protein